MLRPKKRIELAELNEANITPLADVTTTLIVVFLVTMPTMLWRGIQVSATEGEGGDHQLAQEVRNRDQDDLLTIAVQPEGITVNRKQVAFVELRAVLIDELAAREDKTVVVVPSDYVDLGQVVEVLDIAKSSGAGALALLNMEEPAREVAR